MTDRQTGRQADTKTETDTKTKTHGTEIKCSSAPLHELVSDEERRDLEDGKN